MAIAPSWLFAGAVVERELDDVSDIWAEARVVKVALGVADLLYEDGVAETMVPLDELRPAAQKEATAAMETSLPVAEASLTQNGPGDACSIREGNASSSREKPLGVTSQVGQLRLAAQNLQRNVASMRGGYAELVTELGTRLEMANQGTLQAFQRLSACQLAESTCLAGVRLLADEAAENQADLARLIREWRHDMGEDNLLAMLLESPQTNDPLMEKPSFLQVPMVWDVLSTTVPGIEAAVLHEVSQALVRPLGECFYTYRIHRFTLSGSSALNSLLLEFAAAQAAADAGVQVSNFGGYHSKQDLFNSSDIAELRHFSAACVRRVAQLTCDAAGAAAPMEGNEPVAWVNMSGPGDLNKLHHHGEHSLASSYYAQIPNSDERPLVGTLLFRLSPGTGDAHAEPHAERHVPWLCKVVHDEPVKPGVVQYVEFYAQEGMLVVFPAWLSHSVAPTLPGAKPRVSFAMNWDFQTPSDNFPDNWQWFSSAQCQLPSVRSQAVTASSE